MQHNNQTKRGALKYMAMLFVQRVTGLLLFVLAADEAWNLRGAVNFILYFVISIIACIVMYRGHQETLNERRKKQENTKQWDKILLPIYVLLAYYGIYLIAGFGVRFSWPHLSNGWLYLGIVIYLISGVFTVWPAVENKHFESTSRIQTDRSQTVVSSGPYRIVRHPGYLGIFLWAISVTMIFGTVAVSVNAVIIMVVIVIRTYLEDTMLKVELTGYQEYSDQVKCRLIPYIW